MARYRRRRYSGRRAGSSRYSTRTKNLVRTHGVQALTESDNAGRVNLLADAQAQQYAKDLTPSTVTGVYGWWTFWLPNNATVDTQGFVGLSLIDESQRMMGLISSEAEEGNISPLDTYGRYQNWHYRSVRACITTSALTESYTSAQQARDNRVGIAVNSPRKMRTVDDSYWMVFDTTDMAGEPVNLAYSLTIVLREP